MNFFGHAAVASWRSPEPGFVLGAMLPDFATMIGTRPPTTDHQELRAGVGFHHATDAVFHELSAFRSLTARAFDELRALGLGRGSARAAAHIGVEILLDGVLAEEAGARAAYTRALAARATLSTELAWPGGADSAAFAALLLALERRGLHPDHTGPEILAFRVGRALSSRPRLALEPGGEQTVRRWAEAAERAVRAESRELIGELEAKLGSSVEMSAARG